MANAKLNPFLRAVRVKNKKIPVFVNPSKSEVLLLLRLPESEELDVGVKNLRGIIASGNVYLWPGGLYHTEAITDLANEIGDVEEYFELYYWLKNERWTLVGSSNVIKGLLFLSNEDVEIRK